MSVQLSRSQSETSSVVPRHLPLHRFSVEHYHRLIETGAITASDRVELLEGWIVDKTPQLPLHAGTISLLQTKLLSKLPRGWIVRVQSPITLEDSEPEPDLVVVRGPEERYLTAHPAADDIEIVIEVSDASLESDRTTKSSIYARAGIACYLIVNLSASMVEVYTHPQKGKRAAYRTRDDHDVDQSLSITIGERDRGKIPVAQLFP